MSGTKSLCRSSPLSPHPRLSSFPLARTCARELL
nr:MAG TPA: hypothetical protein [Caudoviricetes sp.]